MDSAMDTHPITHGDDNIQVVEIHVAGNLMLALGLNYPEFPDS